MTLLTYLVGIIILAASFVVEPQYQKALYYTGLFSISGTLTNQIAIFMLFERIPLLYGSGVIERNFTPFKNQIKQMVMEQFFSQDSIEQFLSKNAIGQNISAMADSMDFSKPFDTLVETIMESKFGSAIELFGGKKILYQLQEPLTAKLKSSIVSMVQHQPLGSQSSKSLHKGIETLIDERLEALTPKMVKELVHQLIAKHLGWLVVWGGLFGGIIGLLSTLI